MKGFLEIVKNRKSIREFEDREVERDLIEKIMEAAIYSPTAMNKQDRRFTVIRNKDIIARFEEAIKKGLGIPRYSLHDAPVFVIISVPVDSDDGIANSSTAMQNLYLAVENYGLGSCWINQFKYLNEDPGIRSLYEELGIPSDEKVYAAMIIGYPDEKPEEKNREEKIIYID
ncbi:MAG: nitroreductase family protein [Tissierellia bacterium]|nr:nitroreductase family protein [Tissierellia bacterium]